MDFPTIWGRHDIAAIDAVAVRGRLLTSILRAPDRWQTSLRSLGFSQASDAWVKLGTLSQSEFHLLSPEIDLVGFRAEFLIDGDPSWEPESIVPPDVQDVLLHLWQHHVGAVLVALSMEHDTNFTRSQAWSFVESAMEGSTTPETETLFGLALTKLRIDQRLSPGAADFGVQIGWQQREQLRPSHGRKLLARGETVQWADGHGVVHSSRLARKVYEEDTGCWVFSDSPRWVAGVMVATPQWIRRDQLQFSGWSPVWLEADLVSAASPFVSSNTADLSNDDVLISEEQLLILRRIASSQRLFPADGWVDVFDRLEQTPTAFTAPLTAEQFADVREWLQDLAARLDSLTNQYYGRLPIRFVLTTDRESICLKLGIRRTHTIEVAGGGGEVLMSTSEPGALQLISAAKLLEAQRSIHERKVLESAVALGNAAGAVGPVLPRRALSRAADNLLMEIAGQAQGGLTPDMLYSVMAVRYESETPMSMVLSSHLSKRYSDALTADFQLASSVGVGSVSVEVTEARERVYEVGHVLSALNEPKLHSNWIEGVPAIDASLKEIVLSWSLTIPPGYSNLEGVSFLTPSRASTRNLAPHSDDASLASSYSKLIDFLDEIVDASGRAKLEQLRSYLTRMPLKERFASALVKLKGLPRVQVESFVREEIARQLKGKFHDFQSAFANRIVESSTNRLLEANVQAVAGLYSAAGAGRYFAVAVPASDRALSQSRTAEMQGTLEEYKTRNRRRGTSALIDGIALADPELCSILNGEAASLSVQRGGIVQEGIYVDTGVVAGIALKDIRGFNRATLREFASQMSDLQKAKYLTKELIWPRRSFEELREAGVGLSTAYVYDLFWRSLPRAPRSPSLSHVHLFIDIVMRMKDGVTGLIDPRSSRELWNPEAERISFDSFCVQLRKISGSVFNTLGDVRAVYPARERTLRGYRVDWGNFDATADRKIMSDLSKLVWQDVLKTKKSTARTEGSRVQRNVVSRDGADYRNGGSVTGEDFIRTFGFSGVEYGNWTSQSEREKHLNFAYDSMMDFARLMDWEPMTLSLGGKLGLCIGSRGKGGKRPANAHFEPANMAINLTRMNGDGALAHEYFHAVAEHYGRLGTGQSVDITDTFGYGLRKAGPIPPRPSNGLREPIGNAFFNLMASIMRKPADGGCDRTIDDYTLRSEMLINAMNEDGSDRDYWAQPAEMFARAMEVWCDSILRSQGRHNHYLVRAGKGANGGVYPDQAHLERINHFVSPWLEAIEQRVATVEHPYLGSVQMPILNSNFASKAPLSLESLTALARNELHQLFGAYVPQFALFEQRGATAGLYDVARNLIQLNVEAADAGTFYHEAWHACSHRLLTSRERAGMTQLFAGDSPVTAELVSAMRAEGIPSTVIDHALTSPDEAQAYAFQLWTEGKFFLDKERLAAFYRTKAFADGVVEIGELFEPEEAVRLFSRFLHGELAERRANDDLRFITGETRHAVTYSNAELGDDWDADNTLYWSPAPSPERTPDVRGGMKL